MVEGYLSWKFDINSFDDIREKRLYKRTDGVTDVRTEEGERLLRHDSFFAVQ